MISRISQTLSPSQARKRLPDRRRRRAGFIRNVEDDERREGIDGGGDEADGGGEREGRGQWTCLGLSLFGRLLGLDLTVFGWWSVVGGLAVWWHW
ncbi:hypothetical protein Ddye_028900 [Dipteronia dyeriana]|uniref:Uncharacterized protein n=1 Tax=Dipteronia dyeriana TaxID=168575 RepID=A0AAD9TE60_9ROSI|nr:hypothetical protein Ddye_028900 [Dipteronia dyeriana]